MVFGMVFRNQGSKTSGTMTTTASSALMDERATAAQRSKVLKQALWGFFAGDALASPTHWFYGGLPQIKQYYGGKPLEGYTKPVTNLAGSIMNKSNLNGGGRSSGFGSSNSQSIIGDVINHGKADLWSPSKQIHYHATLQAGENTLEAQLARVLMKSMVANNGQFDADHFRQAYIDFMTTKGSHNDAYASTCHRMFFANLVHRKLPPKDCPDNDGHNVDTIDGLVLPSIVALAMSAASAASPDQSKLMQAAMDCTRVTRNSRVLESASAAWSMVIFNAVRRPHQMAQAAASMAKALGMRAPRVQSKDEITACYLGGSVPALLDGIVKYSSGNGGEQVGDYTVWQALLANANTGGENVHRGSCLGAVLGATAPTSSATSADQVKLEQGLYDHDRLVLEINAFVQAVVRD